MKAIVIDQKVADNLKELRDTVELRDAAGSILGYFEPTAQLYDEGVIPEIDEEELRRRIERWEGIPSAEVRRQLKELM
jgi:hypothetical protein